MIVFIITYLGLNWDPNKSTLPLRVLPQKGDRNLRTSISTPPSKRRHPSRGEFKKPLSGRVAWEEEKG